MTPLPDGRTCGDCQFFGQCKRLCARLESDTDCAYGPCLFSARAPAPRPPVPMKSKAAIDPKRNPNQRRPRRDVPNHQCPSCAAFTVSLGVSAGKARRWCKVCKISFTLRGDKWIVARRLRSTAAVQILLPGLELEA